MSILDWDDDSDSDIEIGAGSVATNAEELALNANLSKDPLNIIPPNILAPAQEVALIRLKEQGLEKGAVNMSDTRITRDDKHMLGGGDVNQLIPFRYDWAWDKFLSGCQNNWMPTEINMSADIAQWQQTGPGAVLTQAERRIIYNALGFFSTADTIVNNNLYDIAKHIKNPEARMFINRQIFDESAHTFSYQYIIQSLGLAESEVFNQYRENLSMAIKDNWCFRFTEPLSKPDIEIKDLIRNLIAFYVVMEGIFFYCGFSSVLSLGRRGRMVGTAEQFQYILRDESLHLSFGIDLINTLISEHPEVWTPEFQLEVLELIEEGSVLETVYGYDINPDGCSTITPRQNAQYMQHIAVRRCEQLGLKSRIPPVANPFGWMAEAVDINKEKNFFETRVTDYQQGANLQID